MIQASNAVCSKCGNVLQVVEESYDLEATQKRLQLSIQPCKTCISSISESSYQEGFRDGGHDHRLTLSCYAVERAIDEEKEEEEDRTSFLQKTM